MEKTKGRVILNAIKQRFPEYGSTTAGLNFDLINSNTEPIVYGVNFRSPDKTFEVTGIAPMCFLIYKRRECMPLVRMAKALGLPFMSAVPNREGKLDWNLADELQLEECCRILRDEVFPVLESMTNLSRFLIYLKNSNADRSDINVLEEEGYTAFLLSRYSESIASLNMVSKILDKFGRADETGWAHILEERCKEISRLIKDEDYDSVQGKLDEWKRFTMTNCRLDKLKCPS